MSKKPQVKSPGTQISGKPFDCVPGRALSWTWPGNHDFAEVQHQREIFC